MSYSEILAKQLSDLKPFSKPPQLSVKRYIPKTQILVVSPHPDDEIIMSSLALRLQTENRCQITNVAVTLGSNPQRRVERRKELKKATSFLGWKNFVLSEDWQEKNKELKSLITRIKPQLIIAPHIKDWHPTHIATAKLLKKSLSKIDATLAWAEYWKPQDNPNFLVEVPAEVTLKQVMALEFHAGEITRNPYHRSLLGWQMDSVRRGSEWLATKGATSPQMVAGQLYRLEKIKAGKLAPLKLKNPFGLIGDDLSDWIFNQSRG